MLKVMLVLQELSLPRDSDFYICGPSTFMSNLTAGLLAADRWFRSPGPSLGFGLGYDTECQIKS